MKGVELIDVIRHYMHDRDMMRDDDVNVGPNSDDTKAITPSILSAMAKHL